MIGRWVRRMLVALIALFAVVFGVPQAQAVLSATNAVAAMVDNTENVEASMWPIVIAAIIALATLGYMLKIGRKAGVRT